MKKILVKAALPLVLLAVTAALTIGAACTIPSLTIPEICF